MKEKLYTIPVMDAVKAGTECPFCFIEEKIEADAIDFVLGSSASYMEKDVRERTDEKGFCRHHFKQMFEYGNSLGNAWILKTHYKKKEAELKAAFDKNRGFLKQKKSLFGKKEMDVNPITVHVHKERESCYVCEQIQRDYERYLESFLILYRKDETFKQLVLESKGICVSHFGDLCAVVDKVYKSELRAEFYHEMERLMFDNLERTYEDISWLIEKYDYRNRDADWKNSKDAVQRGMQKLKGQMGTK